MADVIDESFEANPGYDMGSGYWSSIVDTGCSIDPDYTGVTPAHGSQCLQCLHGATGGSYYALIYKTLTVPVKPYYIEFRVYLVAMTDGEAFNIAHLLDANTNHCGSTTVLRSGSTYTIRTTYYSAGSSQEYDNSVLFTAGAWHRIRILCDPDNHIFKSWIDDTQVGDYTLTGVHNESFQYGYFGIYSWADVGKEVLIDGMKISTTGWDENPIEINVGEE